MSTNLNTVGQLRDALAALHDLWNERGRDAKSRGALGTAVIYITVVNELGNVLDCCPPHPDARTDEQQTGVGERIHKQWAEEIQLAGNIIENSDPEDGAEMLSDFRARVRAQERTNIRTEVKALRTAYTEGDAAAVAGLLAKLDRFGEA